MSRNETSALRKSPIGNLLPLTVKTIAEKSGLPTMAAISGVSRSFTKAVTTAPKAAPMTTATARSTTLPRIRNCRKPFMQPPPYVRAFPRDNVTRMLNRTIILFLLSCGGALAQQNAGFVYVAPGHVSGGATVQGGAGGELVWRFFGIGGDVGYLAPQKSFSDGLGVLSLDPAIHFAHHSDSAIDPYFL